MLNTSSSRSSLAGCSMYVANITARTEAGSGPSNSLGVYTAVKSISLHILINYFNYVNIFIKLFNFIKKHKLHLIAIVSIPRMFLNTEPEKVQGLAATYLNGTAVEVNSWTALSADACRVTYELCLCGDGDIGCSASELDANSLAAKQCFSGINYGLSLLTFRCTILMILIHS